MSSSIKNPTIDRSDRQRADPQRAIGWLRLILSGVRHLPEEGCTHEATGTHLGSYRYLFLSAAGVRLQVLAKLVVEAREGAGDCNQGGGGGIGGAAAAMPAGALEDGRSGR